MQEKKLIKVCGMREAENIANVARLPIDYMGFIFYEKSPRFTQNVPLSLPNGIKKVGVFVNSGIDYIAEKIYVFGLQVVQLHGSESTEFVKDLKNRVGADIQIWKAFSVDNAFDFETLQPFESLVDAFLLDTKTPQYGGSGEKFDWVLLEKYSSPIPFLLSGGIGVNDAESLSNINLPQLLGYDLNSRFEIAPALKDAGLLKTFFNHLKS